MKIKLLPIFLLPFANAVYGQDLAVSISSGYNLPFAQGNVELFTLNKLVGAFGTAKNQQKKYSLGTGVNIDFNGLYRFKNSFGLKFSVNYLKGIEQEHVFDSYYADPFKFHVTTKSEFLRFGGGIFVSTSFGRFTLRPEFNILFGWGEMYFNQEETYDGASNYKYVNRYSGGYTLGMSGGLALIYPINNKLHCYVQANFISAFYSPKDYRCVSAKEGDNNLPMETYEREGIFVRNPESYNGNNNRPIELVKQNFAASSLGFQIGIQYTLWKKTEKKEE